MLNAAAVSLRDYGTGLNVVTFDIDPVSYDPFSLPIRGSSGRTLDGSVVHQLLGHNVADLVIKIQGQLTEVDTLDALWTKVRQGGGGQMFEWRDWYPNRFQVIFTPGQDSFHPVPLPGFAGGHSYTMSLSVLSILQWVGGSY